MAAVIVKGGDNAAIYYYGDGVTLGHRAHGRAQQRRTAAGDQPHRVLRRPEGGRRHARPRRLEDGRGHLDAAA